MHNSSYSRLPSQTETDVSSASPDPRRRQLVRVLAVILISTAVVASLSLVVLILAGRPNRPPGSPARQASDHAPPSTAVAQEAFYWTNGMLSWQRTAYHFQPEKNWMNDPSAPLYYKGWYHLFYQYNPYAATWGNISWGHAVSKDLIRWLYLPLAMVPDSWFDINGVWTGSATLLPNGRIVVLYTGITADNIQVQNLAYPANVSDPLLLRWIKYPGNPTIVPPPGTRDFRDPSTAWRSSDGTWRVMIGSKKPEAGTSLVYHTTNFSSYEASDGVLHGVPGTGMWECVDFYPVSTSTENGLDTSANGPGIKHVLKGSTGGGDYYAIGRYDPVEEKWTPDDPSQDVGIGLRLDYGSFYASKTFFDQSTGRRILWGWVPETDSPADDLSKTWASLQAIPRVVVLDNKTGTNLLQWPVEEVESLRLNSSEFKAVKVPAGSVVPLEVGPAAELDIVAEFQVEKEALEATVEVGDASYNCSSGAGIRGALGPFGFLVIATDTLSERTPIYFYIAKQTDGHLQTFFCADQTRSSKAMDVGTKRFGSQIPILNDENFSMRILLSKDYRVDHSIVESYGQGGRSCITSRIYPTEAIFGATRLFIFNNATAATVTASIKVWQMNSTFFHAL